LCEAGEGVVEVRGLLGRPEMISGVRGLVDQDVVHFVDDCELIASLDAFLERAGHVVAQVVKAELGVCAVGDVAGVLSRAGGRIVALLDRRDRHPYASVDRPHPLCVARAR